MILNGYAVLMAFVGLLRLALGLLILVLGVSAWRAYRGLLAPEGRESLENRCYLTFLLTVLLVGLNLVSWPLLYLLLQSYVPQWEGVMCIYGVMQVGKESLGPSRFLPDLLWSLQLSKPALVFVGGAWFVLYLLNRQTRTGPLLFRLFIVLLLLGFLAMTDAGAELAYVVIPKKEVLPLGGCCTADFAEEAEAGFLSHSLGGDLGRRELVAAYYGSNLGMSLALFASLRGWPGPFGLSLLLLASLATLGVSGLFLIDVAAPTLLQLPYHHCPYDLIPRVPEAVVAIALFVSGWFFLGWACMVRWFGWCQETEPFLPGAVRHLLWLSLGSYLASLAMLSLELALA